MACGILFDFNGVIIDDEPQHCEALIATLDHYGYRLDRETYYRDYLGFDDRECFRFTFEREGRAADERLLAEAIELKNTHYERAVRNSMQLVPGASDFIEAAALDGLRLGIVSGALRREIDLVLEFAGLRAHFDTIVAAEDVAACKPDPQGYLRGSELLEVAPARCVVVEDSLPGLAAARAAGIRCAMLTTSHDEGACAGADFVWRDFLGHEPAELWNHG
jgi:HAD superfamily hydrolase (TIGR01509 family)